MTHKRVAKSVIIIVEGDTEVCFVKKLIEYLKSNYGELKHDIKNFEIFNVKSVSRISNKGVRKFIDFKRRHPDSKCYAILVYDNDVFIKLNQNPPFKWETLKKELINNGAAHVAKVVAANCIEDWFLFDINNIITYLGLPRDKPIHLKGKNGVEKLEFLFKKANKLYVKGENPDAERFINALDLSRIVNEYEMALKPIVDLFSV